MAAFLVCALAIPRAFGESALAFSLGYLLVVLVHSGLYAQAHGARVWRFVPLNLLGAACLVGAAQAAGPVRDALWVATVALHYATTGLNILDQQINPGQQISRQQALRMYTRGNAWYLGREHELGSIETGKLADLVVLDKDYFTVSDAEMRRIRPVMTVINGAIVHDSGVLEHQGSG